MSELWLCREKTAQEPFWIASAGIRIYTIEELCYYLYQNLYFLEEGLMEEPLFEWMKNELSMPRLAGLLSEGRRRGQNVIWCSFMILKESGCVRQKELTELEKMSREMGGKSEFECRKIRADRLLTNGRYVSCIRQYYTLLEEEKQEGSYPILVGNIWHNLGTAHARLFLFEEAAGCFLKAYEKNQNPVSHQAWQDALSCMDQPKLEKEDYKVETGELSSYLEARKEDYKKKVIEYGTV